jgi:hypothetical protein
VSRVALCRAVHQRVCPPWQCSKAIDAACTKFEATSSLVLQDASKGAATGDVPVIIGVTNPYFLKAGAAISNLVALPSSDETGLQRLPGSIGDPGLVEVGSLTTVASATAAVASLFRDGSMPQLPGGAAAGVWLGYQGTCAGPDKGLIAKLRARERNAGGRASGGRASNRGAMQHLLRGHFWHLTAAFLMPLCDFCGVQAPWTRGNMVCHCTLRHAAAAFYRQPWVHARRCT